MLYTFIKQSLNVSLNQNVSVEFLPFDKEQNLEKILILEMIEILNNKKSDMDCFSNIYQKILEKSNF